MLLSTVARNLKLESSHGGEGKHYVYKFYILHTYVSTLYRYYLRRHSLSAYSLKRSRVGLF